VKLAEREVELRALQERLQAEFTAVFARRLAVGESSRPDADAARAGASRARADRIAAQGRLAEARAALAAALGVPHAAIEGLHLSWPGFDDPPSEDALTLASVRTAGLLNRIDVRRALAEVAAAEAALGLELARRFPDFSVGPGYQWDHGEKKFTLSLSITLPVFDFNAGPIAEAEARRKEAVSRFVATQARAIAEMERALVRFRSARAEFDEREGALAAAVSRENSLRRAFETGETDRLALLEARLASISNAASRLEALRRIHEAWSDLENAVHAPLGSGRATFEEPPSPSREGAGR
jgi:outer membrane protein TolC